MEVRLEVIIKAICDAINEFNNNPINMKLGVNVNQNNFNYIDKTINNELIDKCMDYLDVIINCWKGIDLTRSRKQFKKFRKYFVVSKNWFDQRKKEALSQHLWTKIFSELKQVTNNNEYL